MKMIKGLIIILLIINPIFNHGQLLKSGDGVFKLSQQFISANYQFDSEGKLSPIRTNSFYSTYLFIDYNITSRISASLLFPVFSRATINSIKYNQSGTVIPGASLNSIGDTDVKFKYIIRNKMPVNVVGLINLGFPLGKKRKVDAETELYTGDGEFNQMIGVQLLQTLFSFTASGYFVYNNRTKNYSNDLRYGGEIAFKHSGFKITGRFNAIESLFNDDAPVALNGIFSNHRELFSPGIEIQYNITETIGIFASADFVIAARNTLNSPMFELGLLYRKQ